jgi:hypothetical protein
MTAAANAQTIERFYDAFSRLDGPAMAACYASDAAFDDEAFSLRGRRQVGGMWRMLCDATSGRAHWDAHYRFSATGRLVDNSVDSRFSFTPEGLIATQQDSFAFWTWSRQALGAPGLLLGWTPMLRNKVRATAAANLATYLARQP